MNTSVIVTANPTTNQVITPSSTNSEYGYIRVEQTTSAFVDGWVRQIKKSALVRGKVADLQMLGWKNGQNLPGKIQIVESTTPTNANDLTQDQKVNPQSGEVLTVGGLPIYRKSVYTTDVNLEDVLVQHDGTMQVAQGAFAGAGAQEDGDKDF